MAQIERLQFITNGTTEQQILFEVSFYLKGGGRWVQLRMKDASDSQLADMAYKVKALCDDYGATLIINDRAEICKAVDCAGVHLGKCDMSVEQARNIVGDHKIIGRTCNTVEDVVMASQMDVNYLGVGPLRYTTTKKLLSPILGIDGYSDIIQQTINPKPIIAIGGITTEDIAPLLDVGVFGIAISGTIAKSSEPAQTTTEILNLIEKNI